MGSARSRRMGDGGVTAVLGAILMLALMMTLVPGALLLRQAIGEEMAAQREAAELAAFCARHPNARNAGCEAYGPLPGYRCEETASDVFLCVPSSAPVPTLPAPAAVPTTPPVTPVVPPAPNAPACVVQDVSGCAPPQGHLEM